MTKKTVSVSSDLCSGCGYCLLACSLIKTGAFNPSESNIAVHKLDGTGYHSLSFSADCDGCGYCARYCFYGVLRAHGAVKKRVAELYDSGTGRGQKH